MNDLDLLAGRFEADRAHLTAVATRVLGSAHEAEDAVQEAWVRLSRTDTSDVGNLTGWLTTVVSRVCLDMLRSRAARREEPAELTSVAGGADPEDEALMADAIGPALLLVLDTLTPGERLAFVLHDLFAVPFGQIAEILGTTPAAARQLASRGRRRVQGSPAGDDTDSHRRREVVSAFLAASKGGDFGALLALLDPEVELRADAAGAAMGVAAMLRGADAVATMFSGKARAARLMLVDGLPAAVWSLRGEPQVVFAITVGPDGLIKGIDLLADRETLDAMTFERLSAT
jgi:RNA polymerase sigma factor (sigma-70 family)